MKNKKQVYIIIDNHNRIVGVVSDKKEAHNIVKNKESYRYKTWGLDNNTQMLRYNSYQGKHAFIRNTFGKANMCESDKCEKKSTTFEWALLKGRQYSCDKNDYIMLCKKCHAKYDLNMDHIRKMTSNACKPILQFSTGGILIREWDSATLASRELNINRGNITGNLIGERKTTGGYIFKFKHIQK